MFLEFEHVVEGSCVPLRPEVSVGRGRLDQLRGDPEVVARAANASLEDVADIQLPGNLWNGLLPPFNFTASLREMTRRRADLRQIRDDLLGQAVGEESLSGSGLRFSKGRTTMEAGVARSGRELGAQGS